MLYLQQCNLDIYSIRHTNISYWKWKQLSKKRREELKAIDEILVQLFFKVGSWMSPQSWTLILNGSIIEWKKLKRFIIKMFNRDQIGEYSYRYIMIHVKVSLTLPLQCRDPWASQKSVNKIFYGIFSIKKEVCKSC